MALRRAFHDMGWLETTDGQLQGLALGYDFCAEHEEGAPDLIRAFDLDDRPLGFERLIARAVPDQVAFDTWKRSKPKASTRAYLDRPVDPDKLVEAVLVIQEVSRRDGQTLREVAHAMASPVDLRDRTYHPDYHDMACAWDRRGAVVWVRGSANVARLGELHAAIQAQDLAFNAPVQSGYTRRGGLSLGIASRFDAAFRADYLAKAEALQRLQQAVEESGIKALLKEHRLGFYALTPAWMDPERETGLKFFLNPLEQKRYDHGWFRLDELQAWARGEGPVLMDPALQAAEKARPDALIELTKALRQADRPVPPGLRLAWADAAKTTLGVQVWQAGPGTLAEGTYALDGLLHALSSPAPAVKGPARPRPR